MKEGKRGFTYVYACSIRTYCVYAMGTQGYWALGCAVSICCLLLLIDFGSGARAYTHGAVAWQIAKNLLWNEVNEMNQKAVT